MTLGIILKRIRREWRLLAILLFAVALITGFFSLGPLYIRTVTEVDLRHALNRADPDDLKVMVVSNTALDQSSQDTILEYLGDLVVGVDRYKRTSYSPPQISANQNVTGIAGTAVCGLNFTLGNNPFLGLGGTNHCYQGFAFDNLADKVRVVEGRLPERGPTPDMVQSTGNDEIDQAMQIGFYNRGEVEAVITSIVAETDNLEVGSRFFIGFLDLQGGGSLARVKIVGIVEPINAADSFWQANTMFLTGANVDINNFGTQRYDYGLAFHPSAFDEWVVPALPNGVNVNFIWRLDVDTSVIESTNANKYATDLQGVANALSTGDNQISVSTALSSILGGFEDRTRDAEGPTYLLSAAILILMLYHLITTVTLVLQEQSKEWSTITSRGGSTFQLFKLQSVTVFLLAIVAFLAGPFLSYGFMKLMEFRGPLADVLENVEVSRVDLPAMSIWLSLAAAIACIVVLSFPAVPASRQSLLLLKQAASRPPTRPSWARYFLDLILVGIGLAFLLRLYLTVSDKNKSFSELISDLVQKPAEVVKFVAERAGESGGLTDPFNLIAPALLLTGFALFWLRLFPVMMRIISRFASRNPRLTTPLAVWNVERDPAHYAQLVLLLIGTLALGTASLGLQSTRDKGGWDAARQETGGAGRADLNLAQGRYEDTDWDRLSGVLGSTPVLYRLAQTSQDKVGLINIFALDPADFAAAFPDFAEEVDGLDNVPLTRSGLPLREDAFELEVQVWSESIAAEGVPEPTVKIYAYLQDAKGVPFRVEMEQVSLVGDASSISGQEAGPQVDQPTPPGQWVTLQGRVPTLGTPPYRMWRIGLGTRQSDVEFFNHTVYLDYWQTVDVNGTASLIEGQESADIWSTDTLSPLPYLGVWQGNDTRQMQGINNFEFLGSDAIPVFDGQSAMRIDYTVRRIVNSTTEPSIGLQLAPIERLPAIVSDDFANDFKASVNAARNTLSPPLHVGETRDMAFDLDPSNQNGPVISLGMNVINIVDEFPTLNEDAVTGKYFIILPLDAARLVFNQTLLNNPASVFYSDVNQVWMELDERQPTSTLEAELGQIPSVGATHFAWERYGEILREPLPSAVAGMLYAGFWVSFALSLLDFAFYIAVTAKQRSFTFGVLRSLGWDANNIWMMLFVEQVTLITPALIVGCALGAGLAYLLLPFLSLVGVTTLQMPLFALLQLVVALILGFTLLLVFAALWLRRMSVNQVLRLGEE